ncbi:MAG: hypothetical protein ABW082_01010, partial [Sedimenticola sp.]
MVDKDLARKVPGNSRKVNSFPAAPQKACRVKVAVQVSLVRVGPLDLELTVLEVLEVLEVQVDPEAQEGRAAMALVVPVASDLEARASSVRVAQAAMVPADPEVPADPVALALEARASSVRVDRAAMALVVPATSDPAVPEATALEARASSVREDRAAMALVVPATSDPAVPEATALEARASSV